MTGYTMVGEVPDFARSDERYEVGSALTRTNRSGEAIGHYRQAIALDPSGVASHLNLALDLWSLGRKDEAISVLSAAIRLNPSSAVLHTLLGRILELNNQPGAALDQLGVLHTVRVLPLGHFVGEEGA